MYLGPCQLSVMELFCENSQRLKTVYDFCSKNSIVDVFQVPKYSFCGLQNISAGKNMLKIFENYSAQFTFHIWFTTQSKDWFLFEMQHWAEMSWHFNSFMTEIHWFAEWTDFSMKGTFVMKELMHNISDWTVTL